MDLLLARGADRLVVLVLLVHVEVDDVLGRAVGAACPAEEFAPRRGGEVEVVGDGVEGVRLGG